MSQPVTDSFHIGFLRVTQTESGFVGGLLVTNHLGRPLEFQCTTPLRPNKTQEILYGPTLQPFLFSEVIGKTLCERVHVKPHLIVVQQEELFALREHVAVPIACLVTDPAGERDLPDQTRLQLGRQLSRCHPDFPDDHVLLDESRERIPGDADLREPLERVAEALHETLRPGAIAS